MSVEIVTRRVSEAWVQFESTQGAALGEAGYEEDEEQWVFTQHAAFLLADELEEIVKELQRLNLYKEPGVERSVTKETHMSEIAKSEDVNRPILNFEIAETMRTKAELAKLHYAGMTYDFALPHTWVTTMRSRGFDYPQGHFVWLYTEDSRMGYPAPLTREGVEMLMKVAAWV